MRFLTALISIILIIVIIISFVDVYSKPNNQIQYGVTFSPKYASYLKLDWKQTYIKVLDDLKVKNLRIPTYWDVLEKEKGKINFSEVDFMVDEAEKRKARVILVLGARQPRWPECHIPSWAKQISVENRQKQTLEVIEKVVGRYKENKSIWAYQLENEPFAFWFGEDCDKPDSNFLKLEVDLVKKLDSKKPIIITDSGEIGLWLDAFKHADILGTSVYKKSYNTVLNTHLDYPFPAIMYKTKAFLAKKVYSSRPIINSELQAEPWLSGENPEEGKVSKQAELFSPNDFKNNINFSQKIGFKENYLWGVEWWYFMKDKGYPEYLEYAKDLF